METEQETDSKSEFIKLAQAHINLINNGKCVEPRDKYYEIFYQNDSKDAPLCSKEIQCIWGGGAETKSRQICFINTRFGHMFLQQYFAIMNSFVKEIYTSGHASDWEIALEQVGNDPLNDVHQFVCRSGDFKLPKSII